MPIKQNHIVIRSSSYDLHVHLTIPQIVKQHFIIIYYILDNIIVELSHNSLNIYASILLRYMLYNYPITVIHHLLQSELFIIQHQVQYTSSLYDPALIPF